MKLQMNYKDNTKEFHKVDDVYIGTKDLVYSKNSLETVVSLSEFNEIILDEVVVYKESEIIASMVELLYE